MVTLRTIAVHPLSGVEDERMVMRLKEGKSFSSQRSGEFYRRDTTNGLEISGVSLMSKEETGEINAVIGQNTRSNNHLLVITNSSSPVLSSSAAQDIPRSYVEHFNLQSPPRNPTLEELYDSSMSSLSQTISPLEEVPQLAFAHLYPTAGNSVHAAFALSQGMAAILTNISANGEPYTSIISPNEYPPSPHHPDLFMGMTTFPRGTKFILTTCMEAYAATQPLETVAQVYNASRQILMAAQTQRKEAFFDLSSHLQIRGLRDDVLNALSTISFSPAFHVLLKNNDDMGLAAMITRVLISKSIKEKLFGNFILPERVAIIASRVPPLRRRKTHDI